MDEQTVKMQSPSSSESVDKSASSVNLSTKVKPCNNRGAARPGEGKERKGLFIRPFKEVLIDCGLYFVINVVIMYALFFVVPDATVAMLGVVWVSIIAWRGGLLAGIIACIVINFSVTASMLIPPYRPISIPSYFDGRIPGAMLGFIQTFLCGSLVGYISSLVHKLRDEIKLRKKIQIDLEQKVAELNSFGHTVAHDLKNPLMVINVSIGALVKEFEQTDNVKARKMMSFIQGGTLQMRNIIEALLLFAGIRKIDADKFVTFSIEECVDDALARMQYYLEHDRVSISKPAAWPLIFGYAPWVTEVWVNYLNNAIKYGGNPSKQIAPVIELGYDLPGTFPCKYPDQFRFWVKDNGAGIRENQTDGLFKEFSRLHTTGHEGHGVGLSIVKSVVDKLNGTVGVESREGAGSTFYFTLPTSPTGAKPI